MVAENAKHGTTENERCNTLRITQLYDSGTAQSYPDASRSLSSPPSSVESPAICKGTSSLNNTTVLPVSSTKRVLLDDSNGFLTAVAAQERRVLELKEELARAQSELQSLKRQWAGHEAGKKRNGLSGVAELQLSRPLWSKDSPANDASAQPVEKHRTGSCATKTRKVFAGSRHVRTLSLLSPKEQASRLNTSLSTTSKESLSDPHVEVEETACMQNAAQLGSQGSERDVIFETGKQLVGDFRQGLYTFFEDLKQVTVGEATPTDSERASVRAFSHHVLRESGSTSSPATADEPETKSTTRKGIFRPHAQEKSGRPVVKYASCSGTVVASCTQDGVYNHHESQNPDSCRAASETGSKRYVGGSRQSQISSSDSATSDGTACSSPRTSVSLLSRDKPPREDTPLQRDDITWSALSNFRPTYLTKTATHFMNEWEKSLKSPDAPTR